MRRRLFSSNVLANTVLFRSLTTTTPLTTIAVAFNEESSSEDQEEDENDQQKRPTLLQILICCMPLESQFELNRVLSHRHVVVRCVVPHRAMQSSPMYHNGPSRCGRQRAEEEEAVVHVPAPSTQTRPRWACCRRRVAPRRTQ